MFDSKCAEASSVDRKANRGAKRRQSKAAVITKHMVLVLMREDAEGMRELLYNWFISLTESLEL